MAEHHPEAALKSLKSWRTVLGKQSKAVEEGKIKDLEVLMKESATIQQNLQKMLSSSTQILKEGKIADLIRDLHQEQGRLIDSLQSQTEELGKEIGMLHKNKTSLGGYKQKKDSPPRFMSKRT